MNRRTFLTTTAAVTVLPLAGCEFKPRTKSKWIAFEDQMPESTDKFEIKEKKTGTIKKGQILKFEWEEKIRFYSKTKFIGYRLTENAMIVIKQHKWDWRYVS